MTSEPADQDGAWKETWDHYLQPFLEFCFPEVATRIDFSQPVEFLDQELQEVVRDANLGKQRADRLVRVFRRDCTKGLILIHLEVQSQHDPLFPSRMYQYHHRIVDRFGEPVVSLAVLADNRPNWRPAAYEEDYWGCRLRFEYPICKLLDLDAEMLEQSNNPAAIVISAQLAAQATRGAAVQRKQRKWKLTRRLYERSYSKKDILELYRLIDWLLTLPKTLEVEFRRDLMDYEKEKAMPHLTSIEILGREAGLQEGRLETLRENVLEVLETRFGEVPAALRERVGTMTDEALLRKLHRRSVLATSLPDFESEG